MKRILSILMLSGLWLVPCAGQAQEHTPTLAISGGQLVDGYGGLPRAKCGSAGRRGPDQSKSVTWTFGDHSRRRGNTGRQRHEHPAGTMGVTRPSVPYRRGRPGVDFPLKFKARGRGSIMADAARTSLLAGNYHISRHRRSRLPGTTCPAGGYKKQASCPGPGCSWPDPYCTSVTRTSPTSGETTWSVHPRRQNRSRWT